MLPRRLAAIALLLAPACAFAAEDPLDAFPAETGVVLRLSPPAVITEKAKGFLTKAAPQFAPIAEQAGPGLGSLIGNPTLAGVDAGRPWYVGVLPRAESRPAVVFAVPTSDAAMLKQAVGQGYTFADYEDWTLYSLDAEAAKAFQVRIGGEGASIRGSIVESLQTAFQNGEFAAYLNVPALRDAYRKQIDQARERYLSTRPADAPALSPATQAALENNKKIFELLLSILEETQAVAGNVAIEDAALRSDAVARVTPGSRTAAILAKQTPSEFSLLTKLPRGRIAQYAMAGDFSDLMAAASGLSMGLYADNEEVRKLTDELRKLKFQEFAGMLELGDVAGGVFRSVSVTKVDRPEELLSLVRRIAAAMGQVEADGIKQEVTVKPEAETVDGEKVDVITVSTIADPDSPQGEASQQILKTLFGEGGITQRTAVVEGLYVQANGTGVIEAAIKAAKGEPTGDETAQKAADATRGSLDEKANLLVLYDLPRLLGGGLQLAIEAKALPLPIDPALIEGVNIAPSYTGITMVAGKDEVRLRGAMPAEQVRGLVELFQVLQQAAPRGRKAN